MGGRVCLAFPDCTCTNTTHDAHSAQIYCGTKYQPPGTAAQQSRAQTTFSRPKPRRPTVESQAKDQGRSQRGCRQLRGSASLWGDTAVPHGEAGVVPGTRELIHMPKKIGLKCRERFRFCRRDHGLCSKDCRRSTAYTNYYCAQIFTVASASTRK